MVVRFWSLINGKYVDDVLMMFWTVFFYCFIFLSFQTIMIRQNSDLCVCIYIKAHLHGFVIFISKIPHIFDEFSCRFRNMKPHEKWSYKNLTELLLEITLIPRSVGAHPSKLATTLISGCLLVYTVCMCVVVLNV